MNATHWNTHTPPTGQRAWVWYFTHQEYATWDGAVWRNAAGVELVGVTHWRVAETPVLELTA